MTTDFEWQTLDRLALTEVAGRQVATTPERPALDAIVTNPELCPTLLLREEDTKLEDGRWLRATPAAWEEVEC